MRALSLSLRNDGGARGRRLPADSPSIRHGSSSMFARESDAVSPRLGRCTILVCAAGTSRVTRRVGPVVIVGESRASGKRRCVERPRLACVPVWRGGTATAAAVEAASAGAAAAPTTISTRCGPYEASSAGGDLAAADHGWDASWRGGALVGACRRRWRRRRQQRRRVLRGRGERTAAAVCASGVRARRPWKPAKSRGREQTTTVSPVNSNVVDGCRSRDEDDHPGRSGRKNPVSIKNNNRYIGDVCY